MGFVTMPNGKPRPGTPRKRGGAVAAAVVLAVALAAGGTGAGLSLGAGGTSSPAKANGRAKDRSSGQVERRLARMGLKVTTRVSAGGGCADHSYGQVQQLFRRQPCSALFRAALEVKDGSGNQVAVALAWVDMPDADQARDYRRLVDGNGTGNITELNRRVRFTGHYYGSSRDDVTVVNVQAEPAGRTAEAVALARTVSAAVG